MSMKVVMKYEIYLRGIVQYPKHRKVYESEVKIVCETDRYCPYKFNADPHVAWKKLVNMLWCLSSIYTEVMTLDHYLI